MIAPMPRFLIPVAALLISVVLMQVGASLAGTLVPLRGYVENFPTTVIGALGSAYFGGFVLGCILVPYAVRRVGHIRTFAAISAMSAVTMLAMPMFPYPVVWLVLRCLNGAAASGLYAIVESWLNDKADPVNRGRTFSVYQLLMFSGSLMGQNLLGLADITAPDLFIYASALIIMSLIPVSMTTSESPTPPSRVRIDLLWVFRVSPIAAFGVVCVGIANGSVWGLQPVFASSQGFDSRHVGWYIITFLIGGALGQLPVGRLSDALDRRWVIFGVASLSSAIGLALSLEYGGGFRILAITVFTFGLMSLTIYSLCVAHINDVADPDRRMELATAMLLLYSIGASVGPLMTSALIDMTSYATLYRVTAVTHAALAMFAIWRMIKRPRKPKEDRPSFVVTMPRTAPTVSGLDPRTASDEDSAVQESDVPEAGAPVQDGSDDRPGQQSD